MIALRKNEFRSDFEILDEQKKLRGFLWFFEGWWHVRVDDGDAQHLKTYDEAAALAHQLVGS